MQFLIRKCFVINILLLLCLTVSAQDKNRLRKSLKGLETATNDVERIKYLDNIGWDTSYDNLAVGLKYCQEALALAEKINNEERIIHVCNSIATIYQDMGDINKAISFHLRGLALAEKNKDKDAITIASMNISLVYINQGDYTKALKYLNTARNLSIEMHDTIGLQAIYTNLGSVYLHYPDSMQKAKDFFSKALAFSYLVNKPNDIANILGGLSKCYGALGDTLLSDQTMQRALAIVDSAKIDYTLSNLMVSYASMLSDRGHYTKAEDLLHKALAIYRKIGMVEQEKELWEGFADIYEKSGQLEKSIGAWKRFSKLKDSLQNENTFRRQRELEAFYENEKKENEIKLLTQSATLSKTITFSLIGGVFLLLLFLFVLFKRIQLRKESNVKLEKQNAIIEEKNKDITDSITYARRIQDAILPPPGLMKMKFSDAFVFYRPRDIVSGDFWWNAEKDGKFIVACADCTGHGVPGGFMSVMSSAFLSEIVNERAITDPDMILSHLRRKVIAALNKTEDKTIIEENKTNKGEVVKDGMDIVVCSFSDNNEFEFACANNPLWIIRDNSVITFAPDKFPVGVHHGEMKPFTLQSSKIQKGDMIYIFTDGFADQFGGENGKKFKYKPFQELLIEINNKSGKEQLKKLETTFDNWKGKLEQVDDVLVIGIRI